MMEMSLISSADSSSMTTSSRTKQQYKSPSTTSSSHSSRRTNTTRTSPRYKDRTTTTATLTYSPLVSSCRHLLQPNGSILGKDVARTILPLFPSFCSAIPAETPSSLSHSALASVDGRHPISHTRVRDFVLSEFGPTLHRLGFGRGDRIAVVLPNGPELALAIISTINWASCVPLNATGARSELEMDLKGCSADLVIGPYTGDIPSDSMYAREVEREGHEKYSVEGANNFDLGDWLAYDHVRETAEGLGIPFVGLLPSKTESGIFELVTKPGVNNTALAVRRKKLQDEADMGAGSDAGAGGWSRFSRSSTSRSNDTSNSTSLSQALTHAHDVTRKLANAHDDEVLVLFTSGTTGSKKLVPHCLGDMLVATGTICVSWDLTPSDVNVNLMPLFHVGGIVRQVFSPLLSGGCVICCPSFDPSIFWSLMAKKAFTWYYAAPTMHQIILATGKEQIQLNNHSSNLMEQTRPKLRMIANAAGGLLPSLAIELRKTFHANVLPSYGMTECMPISSPPSHYELERPGTSGVAVGPEIAIMDLKSMTPLSNGTEGPICVRGAPCFRGYGHNSSSSEARPTEASASFLQGGWFNTGDLGYLDDDGYLFITGRSKEVINRGGEIISPLEVEEAVVAHPDVEKCACFSAKHNVLQEVVGIVIVPTANKPLLDLRTLHDFLGEERLAAAKWPQCLVFMDDIPKSNTNKLLRVKLADRLGIPELNDGLYPIERTYTAKCPPKGTPVSQAIICENVKADHHDIREQLAGVLLSDDDSIESRKEVIVMPHPTRLATLVCYVSHIDRMDAIQAAETVLDKFAIPTHFITIDDSTPRHMLPPPDKMDSIMAIKQAALLPGPSDPMVKEVQELYSELLDLDCLPHPDTNFFNLGGSSMLASQLASRIRKKHGIPFSGAEVFHHSSSKQMANVIKDRKEMAAGDGGDSSVIATDNSSVSLGSRKDLDMQDVSFSKKRKRPLKTRCKDLFQLIPLTIMFPIWQVTRFFLFFSLLLTVLHRVPTERNLVKFVITVILFHFFWVTITPLLFVLIKWSVIGTYRPGRYPIWGNYYMRWWFVEVCRALFGRGIYGSNSELLNYYYRLLGAKIGPGAKISPQCDIAEYDLVSIGANAALDAGTVRGFALDNGCALLGTVSVGDNSSVGIKAIVAPNTSVPHNAHLGPQASSYEVGKSCDPMHATYNRYTFPRPHPLLEFTIGNFITFFVDALSQLPSLLIFYIMIQMRWQEGSHFHTYVDMLKWLCEPRRIPFYVAIRIVRQLVNPIVYLLVAIGVKRTIIGKFEEGPVDITSQKQLMRHWLAEALFTRETLVAVTEIIGRHYEGVSVMYRLLGAKVGKRVFWPGSQLIFTGEFDLLEIGDDVVFGSRSVIFCRTNESLQKVRLCAGSNVADNCVVLPGCVMGKNAVLGSSGIAPAGWYLPESSVWFGSRECEPVQLEKGVETHTSLHHHSISSVESGDDSSSSHIMATSVAQSKMPMTGDESTLRPFGKALYNKKASYNVWPPAVICLLGTLVTIFHATLHSLPLIVSLHLTAGTLYGYPISERDYYSVQYSSAQIYFILTFTFILVQNVHTLIWLMVEVGSKWALIGRRQEGRYNYDSSTYNQRWELYQLFTRVRRLGRMTFLDFLHGTPYMATFFRLLGGNIGENACLYPTGGDPYMPEPDLVTIGNNCAIDNAALVCHLNTRGNFELVPIVLGDNVTLRNRSRIQMGSRVESGSMLLEHSLAMTGEIIEADSVWQGAPALPVLYFTHGSDHHGNDARSQQYVPDPFGGAIV